MAGETIRQQTDGGAPQAGDEAYVVRDEQDRRVQLGPVAGASFGEALDAVPTNETAQAKADAGETAAKSHADTGIASHAAQTGDAHGLSPTEVFESTAGAQSKADAAVTAHEAAADPHGQYALETSLGTASALDTGIAAGEVPTNGDLGSASKVNTGTASGEVPTNAAIAGASTYPKRNAAGADWESTTPAALLTDIQATRYDDLFADFVVTGLLAATSATLTSDISAGAAYVTGRRIDKAVTSHTYTASVDTYVDLDNAGAFIFSAVANGAAAPAQPANSIRLAAVVTDAAAITEVTDLRETVLAIADRPGDSGGAVWHAGNFGVGMPVLNVSGSGLSLASRVFAKVPLDTVNLDSAGAWDAANAEYVVPVTGVYVIHSRLRPSDAGSTNGLPQDADYGQSVNDTTGDNSAFIWGFGSPNRNGLLNSRVVRFTAGTAIFLYAFQDHTSSVNVGGSLTLYLVKAE